MRKRNHWYTSRCMISRKGDLDGKCRWWASSQNPVAKSTFLSKCNADAMYLYQICHELTQVTVQKTILCPNATHVITPMSKHLRACIWICFERCDSLAFSLSIFVSLRINLPVFQSICFFEVPLTRHSLKMYTTYYVETKIIWKLADNSENYKENLFRDSNYIFRSIDQTCDCQSL